MFLADYSGFFATGLLIYQMQRGRRDVAVQCLLALAAATAVYQAEHSLAWLRQKSGEPFDALTVAAICRFDSTPHTLLAASAVIVAVAALSLLVWAYFERPRSGPPNVFSRADGRAGTRLWHRLPHRDPAQAVPTGPKLAPSAFVLSFVIAEGFRQAEQNFGGRFKHRPQLRLIHLVDVFAQMRDSLIKAFLHLLGVVARITIKIACHGDSPVLVPCQRGSRAP
jgi:hypothetical protein